MPQPVTPSSNKSFGLVFAVVFAILASWPWLVHATAPRWWAAVVAVVLVVITFLAPRVLAPFNWVWFKLGLALHHIVNPVLMALIYYLAVVPIGLISKLRGNDLLRLKREPQAMSYWIVREPPGPKAETMSKQF